MSKPKTVWAVRLNDGEIEYAFTEKKPRPLLVRDYSRGFTGVQYWGRFRKKNAGSFGSLPIGKPKRFTIQEVKE